MDCTSKKNQSSRRRSPVRFAAALAPASVLVAVLFFNLPAHAQEWPYFVTYSHDMEEPDNLEIATKSAIGKPPGGDRFMGAWAINRVRLGSRWMMSATALGCSPVSNSKARLRAKTAPAH